jgi:hypothetical protein
MRGEIISGKRLRSLRVARMFRAYIGWRELFGWEGLMIATSCVVPIPERLENLVSCPQVSNIYRMGGTVRLRGSGNCDVRSLPHSQEILERVETYLRSRHSNFFFSCLSLQLEGFPFSVCSPSSSSIRHRLT